MITISRKKTLEQKTDWTTCQGIHAKQIVLHASWQQMAWFGA